MALSQHMRGAGGSAGAWVNDGSGPAIFEWKAGARRVPASVQKLAALAGVVVTGRVPDVRPYLAHATAAVEPMYGPMLASAWSSASLTISSDGHSAKALRYVDLGVAHDVAQRDDPRRVRARQVLLLQLAAGALGRIELPLLVEPVCREEC